MARAAQVVLVVKNLPIQETRKTRVGLLGREHPLEDSMTTHSSGESYEQRNLAGYSPWGSRESDMTETH